MKKLKLRTFDVASLENSSLLTIHGGNGGDDGGETIVKTPPRCVNGSKDYVFD